MACLDSQTGAERAGWDDLNIITVNGDGAGAYIGATDGLYVVNIDPRCQA